jgi:triphosphoribosyl-dephospho-CoA synthase
MKTCDKAKQISQSLELAILFEVSADKPGNVNLIVGFEGTRYEHFLASAVATTPFFELAAERGVEVSRGHIHISNVELGRIIRDCVAEVNAWQHGGNTLLGTVILLSPIAVAAGMTPDNENIFEIPKLRENIKVVVESTTPEDAIEVYKAIKIANPSGLGTVPELDINDPNSIDMMRKEKISLYDVFMIASKYDTVCSEWVKNYPITFDVAYPYMAEQIEETKALTVAIIHTFLKVLAEYPDTFIARKAGFKRANEISFKAKEILQRGGFKTSSGRKALDKFDRVLRKAGNSLNPGTTADIIAAALALINLRGYRP